ncbi:MAG TPA: hypothetical protein VIK35_05615 [Verrucomicrobiae bacterium]
MQWTLVAIFICNSCCPFATYATAHAVGIKGIPNLLYENKVLFICIHNSARSQMAEGFLNQICGGESDDYRVWPDDYLTIDL